MVRCSQVIEFDPLTAISILPTFLTVLIPNLVLVAIGNLIQVIISPWYGETHAFGSLFFRGEAMSEVIL